MADGVAGPLARTVQTLGIALLRPWVRLCFGLRLRRAAPAPHGACVYACNHRSFADPPLVGMWSRVPVAYFARASLWRIPPIRLMLDIFHGIPVDRERPGASSMKGALERLRRGIPVVVFPEGTRTKTGRLGRMKDGPALFARRAGVPLIPVYLHRSEACWPRGALLPRMWGARIELRFGRPIAVPEGLPHREADAMMTRRLQAWMHAQERSLQRPRR